jgi:hypothetical protein
VASTSLETWRTEDCRVGINWTGPWLVGWDLTVAEVLNRLAHALREGPYPDDNATPSQAVSRGS